MGAAERPNVLSLEYTPHHLLVAKPTRAPARVAWLRCKALSLASQAKRAACANPTSIP